MNRKSTLLTLSAFATTCVVGAALMRGQGASSAPPTPVAPAPAIRLDAASVSGIELVSVESSPSGPDGVAVLTFRNATGHPVTRFSFDFGADATPEGEYSYKSRSFNDSLDGGSWPAGETTAVPVLIEGESVVRVVAVQFADRKAVGSRRVLAAAESESAGLAAAYERVLADVKSRLTRAGANPAARGRELAEVRRLARDHAGIRTSGSPGGATVVEGKDAEVYAVVGASLDGLVAEEGEGRALEALAGKLEKAARRQRGAAAFAAGGGR